MGYLQGSTKTYIYTQHTHTHTRARTHGQLTQALCPPQVGASSKAVGSGKIGRKGIGFKSVFQVSDRPAVLSPPFQFRFDTAAHGVFGLRYPSLALCSHYAARNAACAQLSSESY